MSTIIGIDLGTTNSLVAVMTPEGPQILENELGESMTPSLIAVAEDGHVICGRAAKDRLVQAPHDGVAFFKRDMGTPANFTFGDHTWTPTECSAMLLKELKRVAEEKVGDSVTRAVITVPAYFHDAQRQATVEAATIAGLTVERILNEPTAAALAFGYATRMPLVRRFITEEMSRLPNQDLDPDRVVALGAAVQAALCADDAAVSDLVLTDVCPHTLGVEIAKELAPGQQIPGYFQPLIDRNTTIPVSRGEPFNTFHPQQDQIIVQVYQGESRMTQDNQLIGQLTVKELKHKNGQKFPGQVEIRFSYDMNGILEVEVTLLSTTKKISKVFEQRPGALTPAEIKEAIKRMAPLKVHPRDLLPNRARIERASRLFEELAGPGRDRLSYLIDFFEHALESQNPSELQESTLLLDDFMRSFYHEEGEHQPD